MNEQVIEAVDLQPGWPADATHVWLKASGDVYYKHAEDHWWGRHDRCEWLAISFLPSAARPIRRQPKSPDADGWHPYPEFKPERECACELDISRVTQRWFSRWIAGAFLGLWADNDDAARAGRLHYPNIAERHNILRWRYTDTAERPSAEPKATPEAAAVTVALAARRLEVNYSTAFRMLDALGYPPLTLNQALPDGAFADLCAAFVDRKTSTDIVAREPSPPPVVVSSPRQEVHPLLRTWGPDSRAGLMGLGSAA